MSVSGRHPMPEQSIQRLARVKFQHPMDEIYHATDYNSEYKSLELTIFQTLVVVIVDGGLERIRNTL
jgi:hypothetical protein